MFKYYLIFAAVLAVSYAECPKVQPEEGFMPLQYLGKWYHQARNKPPVLEGLKCITSNFSVGDNGWFDVVHTEQLGHKIYKLSGLTKPVGKDRSEAIYSLIYPSDVAVEEQIFEGLATDYISYSVFYTCRQAYDDYVVLILTRERNPSDEVITKAMKAIKEKGLDTKNFISIDQTGCYEEL